MLEIVPWQVSDSHRDSLGFAAAHLAHWLIFRSHDRIVAPSGSRSHIIRRSGNNAAVEVCDCCHPSAPRRSADDIAAPCGFLI